MGIGPFDAFSFPGVYTQTFNEAPSVTAAGALRFPVFIGVADEVIPVNNYEMIRGSSSLADNKIMNQDVSSQLDGTNRKFVVSFFPIVTGGGQGVITTDPNDVEVTVNGNRAIVANVNGTTGEIWLVSIPRSTDTVLATYYFKRKDTLYSDEDLSDQADGVNVDFKVKHVPIVKGDNGGITTTNPSDVTVTVNGLPSTVSSVDGDTGIITMAVAPGAGTNVLVTYYSNNLQDTADILPSASVASIEKVGVSPGTADYVNGTDYVLDSSSSFSTINWGHSYSIASGTHTIATEYFNTTQVGVTLFDNRNWFRNVDGTADGTNTTFTLEFIPMNGSGRGIPTDDPSLITAYVGTSPIDATAVTVESMSSATLTFELKDAPPAGTTVFATQYMNQLPDDTWTLTNTVEGATGVGEYTVVGTGSDQALNTVWSSADTTTAGFLKTDIKYPAGSGVGNSDAQVRPGQPEELVSLTFIDSSSYVVTSSDPNGSGSGGDNTGWLNQTYIDVRTGFRVTLLDPDTGDYAAADVVAYRNTHDFVTSVTPTRAIPGTRMTVSDTEDVGLGDTAIVTTYNKSGAEPDIGDFYYVSFLENKTDFRTGFYTNETALQRDYGPLSINNKLVLAAHLCFLNGAAAVAVQQILRSEGGGDAPDSAYIEAIDIFDEPMEGGIRPVLMEPVTTSTAVINYCKISNSTQAGIRYGNERTTNFGFELNTSPETAQAYALALGHEQMIGIYPDGGITTIPDQRGIDVEFLVGGEMLAAAYSGRDITPVFDVAEPMTRKQIVGFTRLFRRLDAVSAAQTANAGLTYLEEQAGGIFVKIALTTDLSSALTRTPSVIKTKHFIQRGTRGVLQPFVGLKNLPQRTKEIETVLNSYLRAARDASIIVDFTGVRAVVNRNDPSTVDVEAFYSPVFPLLWIVVTYNLRSSI